MGVSNWQEAHFNLTKVNLVVEVLDKNRPLTFLEFEAPAFDTRGTTFYIRNTFSVFGQLVRNTL